MLTKPEEYDAERRVQELETSLELVLGALSDTITALDTTGQFPNSVATLRILHDREVKVLRGEL